MNIALAQIDIVSGKCEENFVTMKTQIAKAKKENADIIVFPEMCISGYLLQDKWLDHDFCEYVHSFNDKIKALSDGIGIIFGNLYYEELALISLGRDGRKPRFNAVLFAYDGQWVKKKNRTLEGIHIKHLNPDYRLFDDSRYFLSALEITQHLEIEKNDLISPFEFQKNGKTSYIGLEVCEDLWSNHYSVDVTAEYVKQGVDFIVVSSNSPWTLNKELAREKRMKEHAHHLANKMVPIIYVNACGMQNSGKNIVVFDGGSCVYDHKGECVYSLNDLFEEELSLYDFKVTNVRGDQKDKLFAALSYAIYQIDKQLFQQKIKWIIGLSGGLDSSINACLLVKALGKERVIGYNMASHYNSNVTKSNARTLADALGIEIREGSIETLHTASIETMHMFGYQQEYDSLVYENIQARIRGHLLSTFASIEKGVVVNNANKIEVALGYCTLYGDAIGAIAPIGDLTKVQCFELAKRCNTYFNKEVISSSLIPSFEKGIIKWDMPPSAELKDAQLDPMKWYYHDMIIDRFLAYPTGGIEEFMQLYLDGSIFSTPIGEWIKYYHLEDAETFIEDLEWVLKTMANSIYKRMQMPPIVVVSRGAYGNDYRESQIGFIKTQRYEALKRAILEKD